jgi:stage V sporulation protein AA
MHIKEGDIMQNTPLYVKINDKIVVTNPKVYIKDVAKVYCRDSRITKKVENMVLGCILEDEDTKIVYSIMYVVDMITKEFPDTHIVNMGEEDFVVEYLVKKKDRVYSKLLKSIKLVILVLIVFFGSGFTIMTFNADVDVANLFEKINKLFLGHKKGHKVLEISYSVGIGLGILLFFNHFTKKKAYKQPSPIHVEMRNYEKNINDAIMKDASREGFVKDI